MSDQIDHGPDDVGIRIGKDTHRQGLTIRAPFPWFGGKSKAAPILWRAFGDAPGYVEPFAGSLATLLARPGGHRPVAETVNDKDRFLCNFWRAVAADPEAVARYADWPVNEADLTARHLWLVTSGAGRLVSIEEDPLLYDAQVAGWWVWGINAWIGTGWCSGIGPWHLSNPGQGINRKLPHLGNPGRGINRKLPHLGDPGQGINRKLPHLGDPGRGILDYMLALQDRLRSVRVACGDWSRVVSYSVLRAARPCAVLLDPPYAADRKSDVYTHDSTEIAADVAAWAIEAGRESWLRIALCSYRGDLDLPAGWRSVAWKAGGGYQNDSSRDVVYLSPACISTHQEVLPL